VLPPVVGAGVDIHRLNEAANVAEVPFLVLWPRFDWINAAKYVTDLNPQPFAADVYAGLAVTTHYTAPAGAADKRLRVVVDQGRFRFTGAAPILLTGWPRPTSPPTCSPLTWTSPPPCWEATRPLCCHCCPDRPCSRSGSRWRGISSARRISMYAARSWTGRPSLQPPRPPGRLQACPSSTTTRCSGGQGYSLCRPARTDH
jgi:hypothetical protein